VILSLRTMAPLRAVETRRALARSTATGISTLVDDHGRVRRSLGLFQEGYLLERLPLRRKLALGFGALLLLALALGVQSLMSQDKLSRNAQDLHTEGMAGVARAKDAQLQLAFVRKLDHLAVPVDLHDPAARASFKDEMRSLMSSFEVEAALAATRALDAAGAESGGEVAGWLRSSCEVLAALDPQGGAAYPICRAGGGGR